MATITQEYVNERIRELNFFLSKTNPFDLEKIPEESTVFLGSKKSIEDELGMQIKGPVMAFHDSKSDRIYFIKERLETEIERFPTYSGLRTVNDTLMTGVYRDIPAFLISTALMHENIHRNCKTVTLPEGLNQIYLDISEQVFNGFFKGKQFKNRGLWLEQAVEGGYQQSPKELDEALTDWITGDVMSSFYESRGILPNRKIGKLITFMYRFDNTKKDTETFVSLCEFSQGSERYQEFISDYFKGAIPQKIFDEIERRGRHEVDLELGVLCSSHLVGEVEAIPELFKIIYDYNKEK